MRLPAVLVVTVYLTALAVALREPSEHLLAGAVLLLAICARLALRPAARSAIAHVLAGRPRPVAGAEDAAAPAVAPATPA